MTRIISIDVRGAFYDPENVPEWANGMPPSEMGITPIPPAVNVADYNDDGFVDAAQLALGHARTNVVDVYAEKNLSLLVELAKQNG